MGGHHLKIAVVATAAAYAGGLLANQIAPSLPKAIPSVVVMLGSELIVVYVALRFVMKA